MSLRVKVKASFLVEVPVIQCLLCHDHTTPVVMSASLYDGAPVQWRSPDGWQGLRFASISGDLCPSCVPKASRALAAIGLAMELQS